MKKKFILTLLFLVLLCALFSTCVLAADVSVTGDATVNENDEFSVTVSWSELASTASFNLRYDSSLFEYKASSLAANAGYINEKEPGALVVAYIDMSAVSPIKSITFRFKAKRVGEGSIEISQVVLSNTEAESMPVSLIKGSSRIKVEQKQVENPSGEQQNPSGGNNQSGGNPSGSNSGGSSGSSGSSSSANKPSGGSSSGSSGSSGSSSSANKPSGGSSSGSSLSGNSSSNNGQNSGQNQVSAPQDQNTINQNQVNNNVGNSTSNGSFLNSVNKIGNNTNLNQEEIDKQEKDARVIFITAIVLIVSVIAVVILLVVNRFKNN